MAFTSKRWHVCATASPSSLRSIHPQGEVVLPETVCRSEGCIVSGSRSGVSRIFFSLTAEEFVIIAQSAGESLHDAKGESG